MVNGNYVLYGDRPASDSEIVIDHVQTRTAERRPRRKVNRTANELQRSLNKTELDNQTDSVKYENKIKEPQLLRYVPTCEVEENYVTEKFETFDVKISDEPPKRHTFAKKPKNPADGSVNYAYSRSSSSCSSPNGNLPTISEHVEQYGTYRVCSPHSPPRPVSNINCYETKLDKYFAKPRELKTFTAKGSHPDSLYRVSPAGVSGTGNLMRALRLLRWPLALFTVCVALAVFVYFLMPANMDSEKEAVNATFWEESVSEAQSNSLPKKPTKPSSEKKSRPPVPQCRSTRLPLCRGVLPYDLAGAPASVGMIDVTTLLPQIEYLVSTNCSERVLQFACSLLEPECSPPPYPPKLPCYNFCKAIMDSCEGSVPSELQAMFACSQYPASGCAGARAPCSARELRCGDGSCVPRDWVCDGTRDCPAGEDEAPCATCDRNEYRCSSGMCITKRWLCDGYADCDSGEDEQEELCRGRKRSGGSGVRLSGLGEGRTTDGSGVEDVHEPGEESAGSAPAPSVRKPNRLPLEGRNGENESSKELLMTSDSNSGFRRNFTRRPSPSRLTPYKRLQNFRLLEDKTSSEEANQDKMIKKSSTNVTKEPEIKMESGEDLNIEELGIFEIEKEKPDEKVKNNNIKPIQTTNPPKTDVNRPKTAETSTQGSVAVKLDKSRNKFERVIDGAAMLRKAAKEEEAIESSEANDTVVEKTEDLGYNSAHASPCPSSELRCVDGRCITLAQLCDGTIDCSDHADEDNCYT